jgi:E3 SUMO-protein ligase PIAS1
LISNLVEISWFTQDISIPSPTYIASVFLTERKTVSQLLTRISRLSNIRPSIETQRAIIQTLSAQQTLQEIDDDLEVASTSLRLPLECPAMRIRMRLPGRAKTCKHFHCFDIEGYLRMNEKRPSKYKFYLFYGTHIFYTVK